MVPGKYDITIHRGGTWTITINAENASGIDLDFLTSYIDNPTVGAGALRMQIRPIWEKGPIPTGTPLKELTYATGEITLTGSNLNLVLTLSAAVTAALTFNSGKYELELVTGDTPPVVDKLLYGDVIVTGEVTI